MASWAVTAADLPRAWDISKGQGETIAVVDTGLDPATLDLRGRIVPGFDFVAETSTMTDPNGHGTHVAGIAAATVDNGIGIAGAAPLANIMPVRVLAADGSGSDSTIAEGIDWAVSHGADVINLSLGESGLPGRLSKGGPINRAIRQAAARGVVVVAAAGNDSSVERVYRLGVPVIVVVASDRHGRPASFTNSGDPRSIAAPGVDIISTAPRQPTTLWRQGTDGYASLSGTSMAAPLVSGVAADLLAAGIPSSDVATELADTARDPSNVGALGAGVVDAGAALEAVGGQDGNGLR